MIQSNNNIIVQNKRVENNNAQDIEGTTVVASKSNNEQVNVPVTQIGNYNSKWWNGNWNSTCCEFK